MIVDLTGNDVHNAVRSLKNDISFGLLNQTIVIDSLREYFNDDIIEIIEDKYSQYDAISSTTLYEIKCRRCSYMQYDTTIVPVHKTKNIQQRLLFIFRFTDGLYYIEYDHNLFDTFEQKYITVYRQGCSPRPVKHYLIPIDLLIKINL
jgi:hypothetical protein